VTRFGEFLPLGRFFALGSSFENDRSSQYFWAAFSTVKAMYKFGQKTGWAAFWAILSQNHLVTLMASSHKIII
jgi:hypothetical protein